MRYSSPQSYEIFCFFLTQTRFPNPTHLYVWFTQQVTVAQHIHCIFKMFYSLVFFPVKYAGKKLKSLTLYEKKKETICSCMIKVE